MKIKKIKKLNQEIYSPKKAHLHLEEETTSQTDKIWEVSVRLFAIYVTSLFVINMLISGLLYVTFGKGFSPLRLQMQTTLAFILLAVILSVQSSTEGVSPQIRLKNIWKGVCYFLAESAGAVLGFLLAHAIWIRLLKII